MTVCFTPFSLTAQWLGQTEMVSVCFSDSSEGTDLKTLVLNCVGFDQEVLSWDLGYFRLSFGFNSLKTFLKDFYTLYTYRVHHNTQYSISIVYQDYQFSESWLYCSEFSISPLVESWRLSLKARLQCSTTLLRKGQSIVGTRILVAWSNKNNKNIQTPLLPRVKWIVESAISEATDAQLEGVSEPEQFLRSWNRLKWRVVFFAFLTVLMCMHYIHVSKKMTNDPWSHQSINPADWGVFFGLPKKNGLRPSGYGTCMRAAGRLEDWPCAIFLLQEMQVRIHGWQASRLRCYKDGAKTKKYDVRSSYELQIIPTVSQCLIWIALDLKR